MRPTNRGRWVWPNACNFTRHFSSQVLHPFLLGLYFCQNDCFRMGHVLSGGTIRVTGPAQTSPKPTIDPDFHLSMSKQMQTSSATLSLYSGLSKTYKGLPLTILFFIPQRNNGTYRNRSLLYHQRWPSARRPAQGRQLGHACHHRVLRGPGVIQVDCHQEGQRQLPHSQQRCRSQGLHWRPRSARHGRHRAHPGPRVDHHGDQRLWNVHDQYDWNLEQLALRLWR
ncbi:hypothetical protein BDZ89DRAFT_1161496 [Hymenopellis radicata]|nr:hypothetical protein BDZ89DRAFT_1161496 [Hymenopellis radicata]